MAERFLEPVGGDFFGRLAKVFALPYDPLA
jgi:hypothetical protein